MLQKPITYMYYVYITLPLQGWHKHLASQSQYPYGSYMYTLGHRSARRTKNYNNDDDAGEDRYICIYSLVVTTAI